MKPKKTKLSLYPEDELLDKIREGAKAERRSLNTFCLMILDYFFEHPEILGLNLKSAH